MQFPVSSITVVTSVVTQIKGVKFDVMRLYHLITKQYLWLKYADIIAIYIGLFLRAIAWCSPHTIYTSYIAIASQNYESASTVALCSHFYMFRHVH